MPDSSSGSAEHVIAFSDDISVVVMVFYSALLEQAVRPVLQSISKGK